jgi:hypothetical protein
VRIDRLFGKGSGKGSGVSVVEEGTIRGKKRKENGEEKMERGKVESVIVRIVARVTGE